jgi:hypothetical protein
MRGAMPPFPQYPLMALCSVKKKHRGIFTLLLLTLIPLLWGRGCPCHHGMAHPQVADGGDGLQMWRVAAIVLNRQ